MERRELLRFAMEHAHVRLRQRLQGPSDDEMFWEPGPGCWTLRCPDLGWTHDYQLPEPQQGPLTTIAWQLWHVASCKVMYHEWGFGPGRLSWPELEVPHTATAPVELLERGQAVLLADLDSLRKADLDGQRPTNWGDQWPAWRILWTMADHDALHGGAIGQLRDLYRWTAGGSG
jgi:hypothetical protein